uniref:Exocyst complex component EXOC2/Sec5 N-terminal domain-containing protein n=2 Tax=Hemiselmis andersenii TaxID=464988 RepID=A0A7S1DHP5_HEMAN
MMCLSDCVWVRTNFSVLVDECIAILARDSDVRASLVPAGESEDIVRLCTALEELIQEKFVRGSTLALTRIIRRGLVQRDEGLAKAEASEGYTPSGVREYVVRALMLMVTVHERLRCMGEAVRDRVLCLVVAKLWWTCLDFVTQIGSDVHVREVGGKPSGYAKALTLQITAEMHFLKTILQRFQKGVSDGLILELGERLENLLWECKVDTEAAESARKVVTRDAMYRSKVLAECFR